MLEHELERVLSHWFQGQVSYADRRLLEAGQLREVVERHLRFQQRLLWVRYALTVLVAIFPLLLQLMAARFDGGAVSSGRFGFAGTELALLHLPFVIYQHCHLTKLETVYSLWLATAGNRHELQGVGSRESRAA